MTFVTPKVNAEVSLSFIDTPEHLSKIVFNKEEFQQIIDETAFVFYRTQPVPPAPFTLTSQNGTMRVIPVDITGVTRFNSISNPRYDAFDRQSGAFSEFNSPGNSKLETAHQVALRLIDAINGQALVNITASPGSLQTEVIVRQRAPGVPINPAVYAVPRAATSLGEIDSGFGYLADPFPRRVGLASRSANEIFYFTGGSTQETNFPFGVPYSTDNPFSQNRAIIRRMMATPHAGTISVLGAGSSGLINVLSDQHPTCEFEPFDETNSQAAFGAPGGSSLYGTQTEVDDEFFTRGSTANPLDEPLRDKDKIVIDLTPTAETRLRATDGDVLVGPNFPMAYYNLEEKRWEPIGFGDGVTSSPPSTLQDVLEEQYIGFSQGFRNVFASSSTSNVSIVDPQLRSNYTNSKNVFLEAGWFSPIDTFGFPLHPKYHATGSQQLDASMLVDRPFLVEKIIYEYSASFSTDNTFSGNEYLGTGGVFFILNQRKANPDPGQESSYTNVYVSENNTKEFETPQDSSDFLKVPYDNGGIPRNIQLSPGASTTYVDTVRDLITFARFGTVWPGYETQINSQIEPGFPHPANFMDLAIELPNATSTFSGECTLAAPIRAPSQNSAISNILIGDPGSPIEVSPGKIQSIYASKDSSTRNSIDIGTGRAYRAEFLGPKISYRVEGYNLSKRIFAPESDNASSPYIIKPGDKLVFGWQAPTSYSLTFGGPSIKLLPGKGKLTLYGSYLRDEKPVHNIFKECLTSNALHESVPSGPWALDMFESEPQMCYTGSMREEHVTGTMYTMNADGSLAVTDPSDFTLGGVRAVSARVSSGNVKQRWSFYRNSRLVSPDEQYYDSMQPDPFRVLIRPDNVRFFKSGSSPDAAPEAMIMFPGDNMLVGGAVPPPSPAPIGSPEHPNMAVRDRINTFSNRHLIPSFPFESFYDGIKRVKRIGKKSMPSTAFWNLATDDPLSNEPRGFEPLGLIKYPETYLVASKGAVSPGGLLTHQKFYYTPVISSRDTNIPRVLATPGIEDANGNPIINLTTRVPITPSLISNSSVIEDVNYHLSRFMGCFGPGYFQSIHYLRQGINEDLNTDPYLAISQMIYRGSKHGLINPTPLFSSAIFSGAHYGQFRDMLEQRQYTRFSLTDNTLTEAAVEVQFIDRNAKALGGVNFITTGSATNSSNVSTYAVSGHPYDDGGQVWDRTSPLPETLLGT